MHAHLRLFACINWHCFKRKQCHWYTHGYLYCSLYNNLYIHLIKQVDFNYQNCSVRFILSLSLLSSSFEEEYKFMWDVVLCLAGDGRNVYISRIYISGGKGALIFCMEGKKARFVFCLAVHSTEHWIMLSIQQTQLVYIHHAHSRNYSFKSKQTFWADWRMSSVIGAAKTYYIMLIQHEYCYTGL